MKKALRFRKAFFGAPSGTRTQDPLIKSQLLSQVASSRGVDDSITPTDFGFYTSTTLIISKKPGNTGISRDIRTEFTTDLLLSD